MPSEQLDSETRRSILKGVATALGVSATGAGVASGHPGTGDHGIEGHVHPENDEYQMSTVGYHSIGGVGSESLSGAPDEPHYGGISELRVKGDLAAVGILSSHEPTIDRGVALIDVSAYTRAENRDQVDRAEMTVLSFIPNENGGASVMDVKFSDDGDYLFICKQPVALLFEALEGTAPEGRTKNDGQVSSPELGALQAVDISDPGEPEIVGRSEFAFGPHNCYHHRIGGEDYVFAVKGPTGEPAAIYVHQFDRTTGSLEKINYWTHDTELAQGEVEEPTDESYAHGNEYYAHDITVIDDPVTGDPYAYLANWNSGARVLDVSDPTDIEEIGLFEMERAHTIEPLRRTVDGKRLFVVGQENPGPDGTTGDGEDDRGDISGTGGHTGYYYLVDASGVENDSESTDLGRASEDGKPTPKDGTIMIDGDPRSTELAKWVWHLDVEYDNYTYSAHNIGVIDTEIKNKRRLFVTCGHYHAGTRVLEIGYPGVKTPKDDDGGENPTDVISEGGNGSGQKGWMLAEAGWSRTHENVPDESKFASLSAATPYHWCAVEENGVIFASCISTGVYAMTLDDPEVPVGSRDVIDADITVRDDGSVFTAGQTNQIELDVSTDAPAEVRINLPRLWKPIAGDEHVVRETADNNIVEFTESVDGSATRTVFVELEEAPTGTYYTVGPAEVTGDVDTDHELQVWDAVPDTEDQNIVVGQSQNF